MSDSRETIGFIGQGWVGGNYANDFENRGYSVVRYALEEQYRANKDLIRDCDVVFVCVPTPTTPGGFDASIVESGLRLVGKGKVAVIKSTLHPGTTKLLQKKFKDVTVLCSPEFLSVATAAEDAAHPFSNVIGMPIDDAAHRKAAGRVLAVLPQAPFNHVCSSDQAEIVKYAHNVSGFMQILTFNALYDVAKRMGADWEAIHQAIEADPFISNRYAKPVHKTGRGAGGACFIKDFAAFAKLYREKVGDKEGVALLNAAEKRNVALLLNSNKDLDLLQGVYGKKVLNRKPAAKKPAKKVAAKTTKKIAKKPKR